MNKKNKNKKKTIIKKKAVKPIKVDNLNGVSEEEFLKVVDNISKRLGHKFKFGYHSFEDMKQQASIFALEGLEKYDNKRPLENFLWTHVRNRLFNYKRNNYQRPDKPCHTCPFFDKSFKNSLNQCTEFSNKDECELYCSWSKRNMAKKNIMQPTQIDYTSELNYRTEELSNTIQNKEIVEFLDNNIKAEYRETYLKLKHGTKVSKQHLSRLQKHIQELMKGQSWNLTKLPENEDN